MKKIYFSEISGNSLGYLAIIAGLGLLVALGFGAFLYMEHNGHWVTGMNNEIVWGLPHVFAVFLIVAADFYKPDKDQWYYIYDITKNESDQVLIAVRDNTIAMTEVDY